MKASSGNLRYYYSSAESRATLCFFFFFFFFLFIEIILNVAKSFFVNGFVETFT